MSHEVLPPAGLPSEPGLYIDPSTYAIFTRDEDGTWWSAAQREFWAGDDTGWYDDQVPNGPLRRLIIEEGT